MGKLLPTPYPGQSMDEYKEQLVNFQKNYCSFLKTTKGGGKYIPLPPLSLIKKTKEMLRKKSNQNIEGSNLNKEKRVIPSIPSEQRMNLSEELELRKVKKTTPIPFRKKRQYYKQKNNVGLYFWGGIVIGTTFTLIFCKIMSILNSL